MEKDISLDKTRELLDKAFTPELRRKLKQQGIDVELDEDNFDLTDLEKRVYSGETIVGDKKMMYWKDNKDEL